MAFLPMAAYIHHTFAVNSHSNWQVQSLAKDSKLTNKVQKDHFRCEDLNSIITSVSHIVLPQVMPHGHAIKKY